MKFTVEKIENYRGPGHTVWAVSDGEFDLILDRPHHQFHLEMVTEKFLFEKEKR